MADLPKQLRNLYGEVLISRETPRAILHGKGNHALPRQLCRIGNSRADGLVAQRGRAVYHLIKGETHRQMVEHDRHLVQSLHRVVGRFPLVILRGRLAKDRWTIRVTIAKMTQGSYSARTWRGNHKMCFVNDNSMD
jgi:hypothetical protein